MPVTCAVPVSAGPLIGFVRVLVHNSARLLHNWAQIAKHRMPSGKAHIHGDNGPA